MLLSCGLFQVEVPGLGFDYVAAVFVADFINGFWFGIGAFVFCRAIIPHDFFRGKIKAGFF